MIAPLTERHQPQGRPQPALHPIPHHRITHPPVYHQTHPCHRFVRVDGQDGETTNPASAASGKHTVELIPGFEGSEALPDLRR